MLERRSPVSGRLETYSTARLPLAVIQSTVEAEYGARARVRLPISRLVAFLGVRQNPTVSRYDALREILAGQPAEVHELAMTFAEIEDIVGPLPDSARRYRPWWGNTARGQALSWLAAGWHVGAVDLGGERVTMRRRSARGKAPEPVPAMDGRHIFLSYSHADAAYVNRLKAHLTVHGLEVWTDEGIDYGAQWSAVIEEKIETCRIFVPLMTPESRAAPWVNREIDLAQELDKPILPLLLAGRPFLALRDLQYEDVTDGGMPSDRFVHRLHPSQP